MTGRRLSRFRVGEHVLLPDGRAAVYVQTALEDDTPYRLPMLVPCVRTTRIPGLGQIGMGGSCSGHEDCRAEWYRKSRHATARGAPVPRKSRIRRA